MELFHITKAVGQESPWFANGRNGWEAGISSYVVSPDVLARNRYWDGVVPSSFLNTALKWLWLEKPNSNARSVMSWRSGRQSNARLRRSNVW